MKSFKKILSAVMCVSLIALCFAGCSSSESDGSITDETLLIAYTEENSSFLYADENGDMTGFEVEVIDAIFDDIKGDYTSYQFVQVDEGYTLGEDVAYTDEEGNEYTAEILAGGQSKNNGTFNVDYSFTKSVISDRVITITASGSEITNYADLHGKKVAIIGDEAVAALDNNTAIKDGLKSVKDDYADIDAALSALDAGKIDAVVTDEFTFNVLDNASSYAVLNGELETIEYVFAFEKYSDYKDSFNEAISELQDPDYNDVDEFTPIVESYFGYDASTFEYSAVEE